MKRIDIHYGGERYSVGRQSLDDIRGDIERALEAGHGWIEVNDGDGALRTAFLLVAPGVPLAIIPIPEGDIEDASGPVDISETLVSS